MRVVRAPCRFWLGHSLVGRHADSQGHGLLGWGAAGGASTSAVLTARDLVVPLPLAGPPLRLTGIVPLLGR